MESYSHRMVIANAVFVNQVHGEAIHNPESFADDYKSAGQSIYIYLKILVPINPFFYSGNESVLQCKVNSN